MPLIQLTRLLFKSHCFAYAVLLMHCKIERRNNWQICLHMQTYGLSCLHRGFDH